MKKTENDPDILQYLDETDTQWTKLWIQAAKPKPTIHFSIATLPYSIQEIKH